MDIDMLATIDPNKTTMIPRTLHVLGIMDGPLHHMDIHLLLSKATLVDLMVESFLAWTLSLLLCVLLLNKTKIKIMKIPSWVGSLLLKTKTS